MIKDGGARCLWEMALSQPPPPPPLRNALMPGLGAARRRQYLGADLSLYTRITVNAPILPAAFTPLPTFFARKYVAGRPVSPGHRPLPTAQRLPARGANTQLRQPAVAEGSDYRPQRLPYCSGHRLHPRQAIWQRSEEADLAGRQVKPLEKVDISYHLS